MSKLRRFLSLVLIMAIFVCQYSTPNKAAAEDTPREEYVIRSGSMAVSSSGIYKLQSKGFTLPVNVVVSATASVDNGQVTLTREGTSSTGTAAFSSGNPTSFANGSKTLTDNGNTTSSGSASANIPGLYDVVSTTTTNGTVTTTVSGNTLTANWSGGSKYQVRVPPYTETVTEVSYQNYSHYSTHVVNNGCPDERCNYTYTFYSYDSNCSLTSESYSATMSRGMATGTFGTITCSKPVYTSKTVDVYNYEDRWDYSATIQYRTATYDYHATINYDYKDFQPIAPSLVAPPNLSDGGEITFTKPSDDYTHENDLLVSLEWQQEGSNEWHPIFTDKTINDPIFSLQGQGNNVRYRWDGAGVNGMIKLRLATKDGYNTPVYSYVNNDPDFLIRMSHKPVINPIAPSGGEQTNTVTPTYSWSYTQDEGEGQKGFYLQVRKVGESTLLYDSALIEQEAGQFVQPSSNPLSWGDVHEWRIRPVSITGVLGDWSDWYAFGANEIPQLESVTPTSPNSIHIKAKPTADTTGYKYYRGGHEFSDTTGLEVEDTSLLPNTEQTYNVRAYNEVAHSPLSPSRSAYSLATLPEIESIETTTTSIILKLKPVNPSYTNYEIEYRKKGDETWLPFANSASSNNLYVLNGVDKDTRFEVRLRAFNGWANQDGVPTDYVTVEAVTKVDVPTNAVFTNVTESSFTVTIDPNNNSADTKYRYWIDGVTDKTEYKTDLTHTFTNLPHGNRTYTVVGQAIGLNSESAPVELGTVTTRAYPIRAEDITLTAVDGKIVGSFTGGKNALGTQYEVSDSATGIVLPYSDTNITFSLPAPNANEKHTITIVARDQLMNVTEPISKDVYSLSNPVTNVNLKVISPNEVNLSFDMNGNPMVTEVLVKSVQGDSYDSGWVPGNNMLQLLNLTPNTKQQYEIKTRNAEGVESAAVLSSELYTLANRVTTAKYEPGYENIKITLLADNPVGTLYKIINKTTGDVRDWSPEMTWDNKPLANEEENEYEVIAKNGDGIETDVVDIGKIATRKAWGEYVQEPTSPAPSEFNPDDRDGKTIELNGMNVVLVKGQELPLKLTQVTNVIEWRYSINDGAWSDWNTVQNNEIMNNFHVDAPGLYKVSLNFKNQYGKDAGTVEHYYLADWIAPTLSLTYDKITKAATAVLDMTYADNLTYDLWYQVDNEDWKLLDLTQLTRIIPRDNKFTVGTIRVSDIVGNVAEIPYEILSLNSEYVTFNERSNGFDTMFNVEHKAGQRYHVGTENTAKNVHQIIEDEKTPIKVTKLSELTEYNVRVGIQLPGESLWIDPDPYSITTLAVPDTTPPTITSISYKLKEHEKAATLFITMEDNQGIDHVLINGQAYPVHFEGYYYKADIDVPLVEGENSFVVTALDIGGNKTEQTQVIHYQLIVSQLTVSPDTLEVIIGEQEQLNAIVHFENGQSWDVSEDAVWSASGSVSVHKGQVTSDEIGTETVTANYEGQSGSATVNVIEQPGSVTSIIIQAAAEMEEGSKQMLRAYAMYATGKKRDVTNNTKWSVDNPSVALMSRNLLTALKTGDVTVTATYSKQASTTQITIVEAKEDKDNDRDNNTGGPKPTPTPSPALRTGTKPGDGLRNIIGDEKNTETITLSVNSCENMKLPDVKIDGGNMSVIGLSPCKSIKVLRATDNSIVEDVVKVISVDYTLYDKSIGLNINLVADDGKSVKVEGNIPMLARYQLPESEDPKDWGLYRLDREDRVWKMMPTFIADVQTIEARIDGEGFYRPMRMAKVALKNWAKDGLQKMQNMQGVQLASDYNPKTTATLDEILTMFRAITNERQFKQVEEAVNELNIPKESLTRQQLIVLANRAIQKDMADLNFKLNENTGKLSTFVDAKNVSKSFAKDLAIATNHNLLVGKKGNRLAANDTVTREEAVTFLIRYAYFSGNLKYQAVRDMN